jgi:hypothetical protein
MLRRRERAFSQRYRGARERVRGVELSANVDAVFDRRHLARDQLVSLQRANLRSGPNRGLKTLAYTFELIRRHRRITAEQ